LSHGFGGSTVSRKIKRKYTVNGTASSARDGVHGPWGNSPPACSARYGGQTLGAGPRGTGKLKRMADRIPRLHIKSAPNEVPNRGNNSKIHRAKKQTRSRESISTMIRQKPGGATANPRPKTGPTQPEGATWYRLLKPIVVASWKCP